MVDLDNDPEVTDDDVLTVFAETEEAPLYAWEVADELPVDEDAIEPELTDMVERGLLASDDDYAPGTVYWLTADVEGDEDATTEAGEAQATGTRTTSRPRDQETVDSPPPAPGEEVAWREYEPPTDPIASFDPPGTPEQKGRRREALRHAYAYLRERGPAGREELVAEVYPDYPGAYESPDAGWWDEVVRPGFEQLPDVERTGEGEWAVTGTEAGPPGESA